MVSMEDFMEVMDMLHPTWEDMEATGAADNIFEEVSSLHTLLFHPWQELFSGPTSSHAVEFSKLYFVFAGNKSLMHIVLVFQWSE